MARNQQSETLRQQVERFVTEGKVWEAYNLLKKEGWVPGGSGHQEFYPNGLTLFAKVDWEKQILTSESGRYWAWEVTLFHPDQYTFLYPTSRQFPFDEVCSEIIRELEKRNWEVEGIQVEFDTCGTGAQKYRMVSNIYGKDFKLWFYHTPKLISNGQFDNTNAVYQINIPKMELSVYEDESGPSLNVYVGKNWEKDQGYFINTTKIVSKLRKKPRIYLKYKGSWQTPEEKGINYSYQGKRAPYLVHDDDFNREYGLKDGDKAYYLTDEVMETFKQWLANYLLNKIKNTPLPKTTFKKGKLPAQLPIPETIGSIFCFVDWRDAERIKRGHNNPVGLQLFERYGLTNDSRLISLDIHNDGTVPEIAYNRFVFCEIGEVTSEIPIEKLEIPGHEKYLIRVNPKSANGIYIADISAGETCRKNIDDKYQEYFRSIGRTIIPITDYKGDFKKPVVLVNRELGLDEVEIVNNPR